MLFRSLARRSRRFSKGDITDALLDHLTSVRQEAEDCYRHRLGKRTWYGMCAHEWCPGQADPDSHGVRGGGFYCAMHANPSMPQTQDPRDFVPVVDLAQVMGLAPRRPIY